MIRTGTLACTVATCLFVLTTAGLEAQSPDVSRAMLDLVMPGAERYGEKSGAPPVIPAYGPGDELIGYVFFTPDIPPERVGYSGPIDALVGMDLQGTITGARVVWYNESYMGQMGDFLRRRGVQEQFAGKHIGEPFLVRSDIDGVTRATVSSRALARGVRDAARRVARAYLDRGPAPVGIPDPASLSWLELMDQGIVEQIEVETDGRMLAEISLAHVDSWATGEHLVGPTALAMTRRAVESRNGDEHVFVYGLDGPEIRAFRRNGWSVVQGSDTFHLEEGDVFPFGLAGGGLMDDELAATGALILPSQIDVEQPLVLNLDLSPGRGVYGTTYTPFAARARAASAPERAERTGRTEPAPSTETEPDPESVASPEPPAPEVVVEEEAAVSTPPEPEAAVAEPEPSSSVGEPEPGELAPPNASLLRADTTEAESDGSFLSFQDDETLLESTLAGVSWLRVIGMFGVLTFATAAFFLKNETLRWATLAVTLGYLGFVDGGFLSVSHITSGIWVGATAFLNDLPLLMIAAFTVLSTLLFGRVFCGFLCPFGALQDFLTRVVPRRLHRVVPARVHRPGLWIKYGVLALILIPAILGSHTSIYHYFEPFGTVFFLSRSWVLWMIALGFLAASAVVPRFYCRYACPLGAALAVGSVLAPGRIRRVEQCNHCQVCEQACPTGAITGPRVDFKECVRCNVCEIELLERSGVCRHDMETVRSRLVQIEVGGASGGAREG